MVHRLWPASEFGFGDPHEDNGLGGLRIAGPVPVRFETGLRPGGLIDFTLDIATVRSGQGWNLDSTAALLLMRRDAMICFVQITCLIKPARPVFFTQSGAMESA